MLPQLEVMTQKLSNPAIAKQVSQAKALEEAAYNVRTSTLDKLRQLNGEAARFTESLRNL